MTADNRHPRHCKAVCDWPYCTQPGCVDPNAANNKLYKNIGEVLLAILVVVLVIGTVLFLAGKAILSTQTP